MEPVKNLITETIKLEGEQWLGCGMTYTLFECLKERIAELMEGQPAPGEDDDSEEDDDSDESDDDSDDVEIGKLSIAGGSKPKKEQLTKAQKRRQWDQSTVGGEKPRGYDWVDIVKHLSQCGRGEEQGAVPQNFDG